MINHLDIYLFWNLIIQLFIYLINIVIICQRTVRQTLTLLLLHHKWSKTPQNGNNHCRQIWRETPILKNRNSFFFFSLHRLTYYLNISVIKCSVIVGASAVPAGKENGELGEFRNKLLTFLDISTCYEPARLISDFPFDGRMLLTLRWQVLSTVCLGNTNKDVSLTMPWSLTFVSMLKACWRNGLCFWVVWVNMSKRSSSMYTSWKTPTWLKSEYSCTLKSSTNQQLIWLMLNCQSISWLSHELRSFPEVIFTCILDSIV